MIIHPATGRGWFSCFQVNFWRVVGRVRFVFKSFFGALNIIESVRRRPFGWLAPT
jgi:hypothetical protein